MCISKMLLKEVKNSFRFFMAFIFMFSSTMAFSANASLQKHIGQLNKNQSVWTYSDSLKQIFKTQEDALQIDKIAQELEGPTKKWLWRLEMQNDNSIAFRVNGKVQGVIENYNQDENSFVLNGQKIVVRNGESFLSFKTNFMNAFNKKTASLDSLFFSEAEAFAFLPFLMLFGIGASVAHAASTPQNPNAEFKNGSRCNSNQMPGTHSRRVTEVRKNFRSNMKFNGRINTQYPFESACVEQYASIGSVNAIARCKCIYRKQLNCSSGGYNMTLSGATNLCIEAQTGQGTRPTQPAYPSYPQDPVTPCYNDKGQVINCTATPQQPAYPSYPQDPVTPCYNDKGQVVNCPAPQQPAYPTNPSYPEPSGNSDRRD